MSTIQIDNGYLIITPDEDNPFCSGIRAIRDSDDGCDIAFDTEETADAVMNQLAETLCGKWLRDKSKELLS